MARNFRLTPAFWARRPPPKLTPEAAAMLDNEEAATEEDLDRMIKAYTDARRRGQTRSVGLLGILNGLENMLPYVSVNYAASVMAVAIVKLGDRRLREEGFEDA